MNLVGTPAFPAKYFDDVFRYIKNDLPALTCVNKLFNILTEQYRLKVQESKYLDRSSYKIDNMNIVCFEQLPENILEICVHYHGREWKKL